MRMTRHDAVSAEVQSFVFLTISQRIQQDVPINPFGKQVNPFNDGEGDKV